MNRATLILALLIALLMSPGAPAYGAQGDAGAGGDSCVACHAAPESTLTVLLRTSFSVDIIAPPAFSKTRISIPT